MRRSLILAFLASALLVALSFAYDAWGSQAQARPLFRFYGPPVVICLGTTWIPGCPSPYGYYAPGYYQPPGYYPGVSNQPPPLPQAPMMPSASQPAQGNYPSIACVDGRDQIIYTSVQRQDTRCN